MKTATVSLPAMQNLFCDHPVVTGAADQYVEITVDLARVVDDWRQSLMSHELLAKAGGIKPDEALSPARLARRFEIREAYRRGEAIEKPVLGIGIFDSVEIGVGSDILVTLALEGLEAMPVHVRRSQVNEFKAFRA